MRSPHVGTDPEIDHPGETGTGGAAGPGGGGGDAGTGTDGIDSCVGGTPLIRLNRLCRARGVSVWGKMEGFNPGGSAKDRTARALLDSAVSTGVTGPGGTVVESSSGNLGVALARSCALRGISFHCVVDPRVNRQTVAVMEALGATIHRILSPDPATGDWLAARRHRVRELLETLPGSVNLDQYSNRAALDAHADGTMREIIAQLGHPPDHLLVAVSTTGTIGGCLRLLRRIGASTTVTAVDARGSVLYGGTQGERPLPGYGAGVVPELSRMSSPDRLDRVSAPRAVAGARLTARREGFLPGASGGAVVAAFMALRSAIRPGEDAVLVFHDFGNAYLETLYDDDWVRTHIAEPGDLPDLDGSTSGVSGDSPGAVL